MKIPSTMAILGGILVITATFLPAVDISFETLNLWHPLVNEVAYGWTVATLLVVCGLLPLFTRLFRAKKKLRNWIGLGAGLLTVTAATIFLRRTIVLEIESYGLYILLAGGILILGGEMGDFRKNAARHRTH